MMQWIWAALGILALAFGTIGIVVPLLPTVPFLLLAALCFARSSTRLHNWLISHPLLGPPIQDWSERGAISSRSKRNATVSIGLVFALSLLLGLGLLILAIQAVVLTAVMVFIWTRPSG